MPIFRNITGRDVYLNRPGLPGFLIGPTGEFEGSSYYMLYTKDAQTDRERILLEVVGGNTGIYGGYSVSGKTAAANRFFTKTLTATGNFADNFFDLREEANLGGSATLLKVTAGASCQMVLNEDYGNQIPLPAGEEVNFELGEISVSSLAISGSGSVSVIAGRAE